MPAAWKGMGREADTAVGMGVPGTLLEAVHGWHPPVSHSSEDTQGPPCLLSACLQGKDSGLITCIFLRLGQWLDFPWSIRGTSLGPSSCLTAHASELCVGEGPLAPQPSAAGAGPAEEPWTGSLIIY